METIEGLRSETIQHIWNKRKKEYLMTGTFSTRAFISELTAVLGSCTSEATFGSFPLYDTPKVGNGYLYVNVTPVKAGQLPIIDKFKLNSWN